MIPLVMAIALAYIMLPFVELVKKLKAPHWLAVSIVTTVILGIFGYLAFLLVGQVADFISVLPQYKDQILEKIQSWSASIGNTWDNSKGYSREQMTSSRRRRGSIGRAFPLERSIIGNQFYNRFGFDILSSPFYVIGIRSFRPQI